MSTKRLVWALSIICTTACGGAAAPAQGPSGAPPASDQAALGAKLYGAKCASCHGADGSGNEKTPPVVGAKALPLDAQPPSHLRNTPFHTAADVLAFIQANMPPNHGGSLTQAEYEAILAFDLKANGVDLTGKHVDASTAASFVLHP